MYTLKISLKGDVELSVLYDRDNREVLISLCVNKVEVLATKEPISLKKTSLQEIRDVFGLIVDDVNEWVTVVDGNPGISETTTWQRN